MKRSSNVGWGSLKVGILLSIAIVILIWASLSGGSASFFESKNTFSAYFKGVNGLITGSPVWMAGVEVGNVSGVKFVNLDVDRRVKVTCRVNADVWDMVTEGTTVQLGTIGFLGDKYIDILPGPPGGTLIESGSTIATTEAADASALFSAGTEAFGEAGQIAGELDTLLSRINRGEGTLGRVATDDALYADMVALMKNLTRLTSDLQQNQERLVASIERTSVALEDVSNQVTENTGTLGKVMSDPKLYDNLEATTARLDSIMTKIDRAEGTLGLFVNDTAMYTEFTNLVVRVNNLVTDIQANPRKYFKFSVF